MIGFFGLARETFDITFAKKKFLEAKKLLLSLNIETLGINDLITNEKSAKKALNFFKNNKFNKIIIFQTTFTDAKFIVNFALTVKKPVCVIAFPEPRLGERLRLNSICGLNLCMHSLIKKKIVPSFIILNKEKFHAKKILYQFINEKKINNKIEKWKKIEKFKRYKKNNKKIICQKIGIIGTRPNGFYTCDYDRKEVKQKLNFSIKKLNLNDLFKESNKTKKKIILETKSFISSYLKGTKFLNQIEFNKSISIYHGLENLKKQHNLDAFAIRCWPEMFTEFGCASCGPMAMMNENNISCACEADLLGSISCNILNQLNGNPSLLVDIVDIDNKDNSVVFWHCGLAPISMANKGEASAGIHSNRKKPLLHDFSLKPGKITIFRVSKSANKLKFFLLRGAVINRKNSFSGTSGVVRLGKNSGNKIEKMFRGGLEHHIAFTYGDVYDEIIQLGNNLKIPTYTL